MDSGTVMIGGPLVSTIEVSDEIIESSSPDTTRRAPSSGWRSGLDGSSGPSFLDRLLGSGSGPLTQEGLFLLMYEMLSTQNEQIKGKAEQFEYQIGLQKQYAEFRKIMQAAQSYARSHTEEDSDTLYLTRSNLSDMGFTETEIAAIFSAKAGSGDYLSTDELAAWANVKVFGEDHPELYVEVARGGFNMDQFQSNVLDKIEAAQEANCADTTLMSTELSELVHEQQRLSSTFSNILSKLHESAMSVIRNI
jgi:hypothetical protein